MQNTWLDGRMERTEQTNEALKMGIAGALSVVFLALGIHYCAPTIMTDQLPEKIAYLAKQAGASAIEVLQMDGNDSHYARRPSRWPTFSWRRFRRNGPAKWTAGCL